MTARLPAAQEHRYVADRFAGFADRATAGEWGAPAPVPGWTARDVVGHLIEWLPGFLGPDLAGRLPAVDLADPAVAWRQRAADVQTLIETGGDQVVRNPHIGEHKLPNAIDQFYTSDVFMHTWDLARALGAEPDLDEARAAELLAGMRPMEEMLRAGDQYGPPVPVPTDATAQEKLIGFIGRDPGWRRPG